MIWPHLDSIDVTPRSTHLPHSVNDPATGVFTVGQNLRPQPHKLHTSQPFEEARSSFTSASRLARELLLVLGRGVNAVDGAVFDP